MSVCILDGEKSSLAEQTLERILSIFFLGNLMNLLEPMAITSRTADTAQTKN